MVCVCLSPVDILLKAATRCPLARHAELIEFFVRLNRVQAKAGQAALLVVLEVAKPTQLRLKPAHGRLQSASLRIAHRGESVRGIILRGLCEHLQILLDGATQLREARVAVRCRLTERRRLIHLRDRQLQVLPPQDVEEDGLKEEGICGRETLQAQEREELRRGLLVFG